MDPNDSTFLDLGWNNDDAWVEYVEGLRPSVQAIAMKYSGDEGLREDAVQNAMIELLQQFPEQIRGYEDFVRGDIDWARWQEILKSFCLTVARNEILSTLLSHTKGDLYVGRTRTIRRKGSPSVKTHIPSRYVSLDQLIEESGLQVSEEGDLSWSTLRDTAYGDEDT